MPSNDDGHTDPPRNTQATTQPALKPPEDGEPNHERRTIGRFVVVEQLGAGGMGVVFAAYDPTLDRKVAVKVLHGEQWRDAATRGGARIIREAQAMAKLSHPNVITLHEVGFDDDGAFLVMDYVAGRTLRDWLTGAPRSWREIVTMFSSAGEGLVAAHREGIVHRDFKPDNVLVDSSGRARVTDFGIAAIVESAGSQTQAGTLPYMAPEQLRGDACDARADQFAFCAALWNALYGGSPFDGDTPETRLAEQEAGKIIEHNRHGPRWLRATLRRGLAADAAARWPSMTALLDLLRRRRRTRGLIGAVTAIALAATGLWLAWPSTSPDKPCTTAARQLVSVWDTPRKAVVFSAFSATRVPYLETTWRAVRTRLDRYATDWTDAANAACRGTHIDHSQSDEQLDLRMGCLDQQRRQLGALTAAWARGVDREAMARAVEATRALAPIADCDDAKALGVRLREPSQPGTRAQIALARQQLDALQSAMLTHRLGEARTLADIARRSADATSWAPIRAEAAMADGELLSTMNDRNAEPRLLEASQLADMAHDDRLRLRAMIRLIYELAEHQQKASDALHVADLAEGVLLRVGADELLQARLLRARSRALYVAADYPAARARFEDVRGKLARLLGPNDEETIAASADLAQAISTQGDQAAAQKLYEETLEIAGKALGADHPQIAYLLHEQGNALYSKGDIPGAKDAYARALAVAERVFGPDSPYTASVLQSSARIPAFYRDYPAARATYERALAIRERSLGPDHPYVAVTLGNLGSILTSQGDIPAALVAQRRALAVKLKAYGPDHPSVAIAYDQLGCSQRDLGDLPAALDSFQHEFEIRKKTLGLEHDLTQVAAGCVAGIYTRQHRCQDAMPLFEKALAVLQRSGSDAPIIIDMLLESSSCALDLDPRAPVHERLATARKMIKAITNDPDVMGLLDFLTARVAWAEGRRAEAVRQAQRALREMVANEERKDAIDEVRAWLAAHVL